MSDLPTVPVPLRVHLAHAAAQAVADGAGADILHIKGPAANVSLRTEDRASSDADVIARPSHLERLTRGLARHGWTRVTGLSTGGLIEHSTNWYHGQLGQLDVHVRFPGIYMDAEEAFARLWGGRVSLEIAHWPCQVPDAAAHKVILLLHAARGMDARRADVDAVWGSATPEEREGLRALAVSLDAEVAFSVAIGELELHRGRPEYPLWRLYADGATTTAGLGRVKAEISASRATGRRSHLVVLRYVAHVLLHMRRRLANQLGRQPTPRELADGYSAFIARGFGRKPPGGGQQRELRELS